VKLKEHWKNLISPLLKDAAYFNVAVKGPRGCEDFWIEVAWILDTDPSRPNKQSKTLRIIFPWETIIDYEKKPKQWQKKADERIIQFIKSNLNNLDLDHDNPINVPAPVVELIISTDVLYKNVVWPLRTKT
jgi:hypothetical protein